MIKAFQDKLYSAPLLWRLMAAMALPVLAMTYLATEKVAVNISTALEMDALNQDIEFTIGFSSIIHELQKERGYSSAYVGSQGELFGSELKDQRKQTDKLIEDLKRVAKKSKMTSSHLQEETRAVMALFDTLAGVRARIDLNELSFDEVYAFYSSCNTLLLHVIGEAASHSTNSKINHLLHTYSLLLNLKEVAGKERALVNQLLTSRSPQTRHVRQWTELVGAQRTYEDSIKDSSQFMSWDLQGQYTKVVVAPETQTFLALRDRMIHDNFSSQSQISARKWILLSTTRINGIRSIEARLADHIRRELSWATWRAYRNLLLSLLFVIAGGIIILYLSHQVVLSILSPTRAALVTLRKLVNTDEENSSQEEQANSNDSHQEELNELLLGIVQLSARIEQSQIDLHRQNEYIRATINSLGETLLVFDSASRLGRVNDPALEILGYDRKELLGEKASRLFRDNKTLPDCDDFKQMQSLIASGKLRDHETYLTTKSGAHIPVFLTGTLLKGEGQSILGYVLSARDARQSKIIADLMDAQRELDEMAKFPRLNPSPVLRLDRNGKIEVFNPAASRFFDESDLNGRYWTEVCSGITPNQLVQVALLGNSFECEVTQNRRTQRFLHTYLAETGHINIYGFDVTELKRAEQELHTSARFSSVAELAGQIAHEINSPLGAIILGADLIKRAFEKGKLDETLLFKHLDTIINVAERISRITTNMRRLALGINNTEFTPFTINQLLAETGSLIEEKAKAQCVELRILPDPQELVAFGNEMGLSHALYTLINDSFKRIADEREKWVEISASETADKILIHIRSSGPGLSPKDASTTNENPDLHGLEEGEGYGGLSVAREILLRNKGSLSVDSDDPHHHFVMMIAKETGQGQTSSSAA
ncbi:MAG: nitrate- and nitrite sensing domain-containing protein [Bdellovibrionaceae bacterium]|nr:nitrate- and nitrite sensing domain-containing protein [Pseudobdellovibrionaceae bacterium]